jgi:phosphate starvation-inducible PhoH-like protein
LALYGKLKALNRIEIVPLGLMRGRSFHKCFIVADECQNASYDQLKMLLTRIGMESKMVLTGDTAQSDLQKIHRGGFATMSEQLSDIQGVAISKLEYVDIVRNPIIAHIISKLEKYETNS